MTPQEKFNIRLKNEYEKVKLMGKSDLMTIAPALGQVEPYVRSYVIRYNIPTFVNNGNSMQQSTTVRVDIPDSFPIGSPTAVVTSGNVPFHVNWWSDGRLCNGNFWNPDRYIWEYMVFIGEVMMFKPERVNVKSPANREAIPFYQNNSRRFPTMNRPLPYPRERKKLTILG